MTPYPTFTLDIPRMGYFVLFRHEKGWVGNQIIAAQKRAGFSDENSRYTHVAVSGGGPELTDAVPPKIRTSNLLKRYADRYVKIVRYKALTFEQKRSKVAYWAATRTNLKYDWRGPLAFIFTWIKPSMTADFCSENAACALQRQFPKALHGKAPAKCMPADFLGEMFEVMWEGRIPKKGEL